MAVVAVIRTSLSELSRLSGLARLIQPLRGCLHGGRPDLLVWLALPEILQGVLALLSYKRKQILTKNLTLTALPRGLALLHVNTPLEGNITWEYVFTILSVIVVRGY